MCAECKRVDQDDLRIAHSPHDERPELGRWTPQQPSERATALPEDVEDALRRFVFDLFDLSPVHLLLLRHVRHGGTPCTFGMMLQATVMSLAKYGDRSRSREWCETVDAILGEVSRQTASAMWNRICERLPYFRHFQTWPVKTKA
jgi:hypothetical protein